PAFDDTVDIIYMIGQHAMAGTKLGVLDHTMSAKSWVNAQINGVRVGEIGFVAYYAGQFDVPLTFLSGDLAACNEAKALIGDDIATAAVKVGLSRTSARCLTPKTAMALIKKGAKAAASGAHGVKPIHTRSPVQVEVELLDSSTARSFLSRRHCELLSERVVRFSGQSITEVYADMFG
ncbi:MAG TPA: M55 family metallopeptidase, partial [Thermoproteota archaeon]|nr:M55 family metallopeptidase [Thermoproteota archaeon]